MGGDLSCQEITLDQLRKQVPIPPAEILSRREVNGVCEVILGINGQYVPVYAGNDYVIAGEMFAKKQQITQSKIENLKAANFARIIPEIDQCVAIIYKPREVKQTVYMVTDPLCPFCHSVEGNLQAFAEKYHAEFKILLYSVHPPVGRRKSVEAVCRDLNLKEYIEGKWQQDNNVNQCPEGEDLIARTEGVIRQMGANGVPMFLFPNGQTIEGANIEELEKVLSANGPNPEKVALAK